MDATTASLLEFAVLLAVSVAAHMAVAYIWAPRAAVRRLKAYLKEDPDFAETITGRVGPALANWAESEEAATEVARILSAMADRITAALKSWLEGQLGGARRSAEAKGEKVALANMVLQTGNPIADGVIAMLPSDVKRQVVRGLLKSLRGATLEEVGEVAPSTDPSDVEGWR